MKADGDLMENKTPSGKSGSLLWTIRYTLINATYFSAFCTIHACAAVFLLGNGFSNTEVGVLLALANIVSAIAQPVIAGIIDKQGGAYKPAFHPFFRPGDPGRICHPSLFREQQTSDLPDLCSDLYDPVCLSAGHDGTLF